MRRRAPQKAAKGRGATDRPTRILVATQPALWSEVLSLLLGREQDLDVVGGAHDEDQVREMAATHEPQVVLLDYEAFGPNSEGIIAQLRRAAPKVRTLVFATRSADDTTVAVLRAGASGLVGKQLGYPALLASLRAVAAGELWAHRRVAAQAIDQLVSLTPQKQEPSAPTTTQAIDQLASPVARKRERPSQLTKREWEVVEGVGRGLRNREIAHALGISERTVKSHLSNIFSKTRVNSRFALSLWSRGEPWRKRQA